MIKKFLRWLITFDEYIYPFVFAFIILSIVLMPEYFRIYGITKGLLFIPEVLGYGFGVLIFLHIYQSIGRFLGFDKNYFRIKKELIAIYKSYRKKE